MIGALLLVAVVNDGLAARSVIMVLFGYSRTLGRLTLFNHGAIAITDISSMAFTDRHASPNRTNVNAKHRQLVQGPTRYHSGNPQKILHPNLLLFVATKSNYERHERFRKVGCPSICWQAYGLFA